VNRQGRGELEIHACRGARERPRGQRNRRREEEFAQHSAGVLSCATEGADEIAGVCDHLIEELSIELPLRLALKIRTEHPELAQPLRTVLVELLEASVAYNEVLHRAGQQLQRLASDPGPGGGRCRPTSAIIFAPKPDDDVQLAKASRPAGLKTRAISETTVASNGENMIPNIETSVRVGKRFGKAFVEADAKSFAIRASGLLQQIGHHIQAGHAGTSAG